MEFNIHYRPAHSLAIVDLQPGETLRAEAGAMVSMTNNIAVHTQAGGGGKKQGILSGLKRRMLGAESFFTNTFTAQSAPAHVTLAPSLCGDMLVHGVQPGADLVIQGSSYVASADSVVIDTQFQGFKGFVSGESLFFLTANGVGPVLINAFGAIETIALQGEIIVDTGHLVAFTSGIRYQVRKASKGWIDSYLSGEGLVLRLTGQGWLYLQTRNPHEYGKTVGAALPARSN